MKQGGWHRCIVCLGSTFGGSVYSNYTGSGWMDKILLFIAPSTRPKLLMVVTMKNDFLLSKDFQMSSAKVKSFLMIIIKKYRDGVLENYNLSLSLPLYFFTSIPILTKILLIVVYYLFLVSSWFDIVIPNYFSL